MSKYSVEEVVKMGPVIPVLAFETVEQGLAVSRALASRCSKSPCVPRLVWR